MLCTILWKTMLSALFICRIASANFHMEEFLIDHGVIKVEIELIDEEADESATHEPRRMETIPQLRYCNYPLPKPFWRVITEIPGFPRKEEFFIELPKKYWKSSGCWPRPEEATVPGSIMQPCKSYDPYCQAWWKEREKERESGIKGDWTFCNTKDVVSAECRLDPNQLEWVVKDNPTGVFLRYKASEWVKTQEKAGGKGGGK